MIEWILLPFQLFFKSQSDLCRCGKPRITNPTTINVWGWRVQIVHSLQCKICTEKHINQWAVSCESCKRPICIGEPVCNGLTPHTFTHYSRECSPFSDPCGVWGEGKVEHELC